MDRVAAHEAELTEYALRRLNQLPGVTLYGDKDPSNAANRLGVIPANVDGVIHYLAAAVLGYEFGIGVRNGCFCAHPYILHLLGVGEEQSRAVRRQILGHDRRSVPGMIRISFGLYNTLDEVDAVAEGLDCIARGKYQGRYHQDIESGAFTPEGWQAEFPLI